jgi:hypothetical protein
MLIANKQQLMDLTVPDYNPPLVSIIRSMGIDCRQNVYLVLMDAAPVICNRCRKQVGTVSGLACAVDTLHTSCNVIHFAPPWFATAGFNAIAYAAFGGNDATKLLKHYIITEYIANNIRELHENYREQKLNELSRYYVAESISNGFEHLNSLN